MKRFDLAEVCEFSHHFDAFNEDNPITLAKAQEMFPDKDVRFLKAVIAGVNERSADAFEGIR